MRWRSELGRLTWERNGGPSPEVGVFVPVSDLSIAGALPAGSELTSGFPALPGLAETLLRGGSQRCAWEGGVGAEVGSHLGSAVRVPVTNLLLAPDRSDLVPVERLPAGAGALPLTALQKAPGRGERISEGQWEPFGPQGSVPSKNKTEISYSGQE